MKFTRKTKRLKEENDKKEEVKRDKLVEDQNWCSRFLKRRETTSKSRAEPRGQTEKQRRKPFTVRAETAFARTTTAENTTDINGSDGDGERDNRKHLNLNEERENLWGKEITTEVKMDAKWRPFLKKEMLGIAEKSNVDTNTRTLKKVEQQDKTLILNKRPKQNETLK